MALLLRKKSPSGGHWYTSEGRPRHTQQTKDGHERNTTLRDARKQKLVPSVTTILNIFAKPGLDRWKLKSLAEVAFDLPRIEGETSDQFADRCLIKQSEPVEEAADFGTRIHDAIEKYFDGHPVEDELLPYVQPALAWKQEKQLRFIEREETVVNLKHGFAGMVDIVCTGPDGQNGVIDWKTRKTREKVKVTPYDFQVHQIAAYAATYWGPEAIKNGRVFGANCYISSTEPGRFEVCSYAPEVLASAWEDFKAACQLWRSLKKYDPRGESQSA